MSFFLPVIIFIILIRGISTLVFLLQTLSWLKNNMAVNLKKVEKQESPIKISLAIPVLREQQRIIKTLNYIVENINLQSIKIIVVTTQKEFTKKFKGLSTYGLVKDFIDKNRLSKIIRLVDYPNSGGNMVHQLNYVLNEVPDDSYFALYNADSKPDPQTFPSFYNLLAQHPEVKAAQQSAIFLNNFDEIPLFLQASAVLQTRWTLTHELPRLLRQSLSGNNFLKKYANAHCVGHGLIIKAELLKEIGGFPTGNITEDLFLGYLIKSKGIKIFPLPTLELADSPKTIKGLWNQKYVWFWGPMKYWVYFDYLRRNREQLQVKDLLPPFSFAVQGLLSAVAWAISGPMIIIALLSPVFTDSHLLILVAYFAIFIYGPLQYVITLQKLPDLLKSIRPNIKKFSFPETVVLGIMSLPAIIFHSLPPYHSMIVEINHAIFHKEIYKLKTDD